MSPASMLSFTRPYSSRVRNSAKVSMPLSLNEVRYLADRFSSRSTLLNSVTDRVLEPSLFAALNRRARPTMPIKIMEVKNRKKKKEKWHDAIEDDSSRAKVWPARAVEEEKEDDDDEDEDGGEGLDHRKLSSALMKVLASISFAEAMQNSSTLYGVSVI